VSTLRSLFVMFICSVSAWYKHAYDDDKSQTCILQYCLSCPCLVSSIPCLVWLSQQKEWVAFSFRINNFIPRLAFLFLWSLVTGILVELIWISDPTPSLPAHGLYCSLPSNIFRRKLRERQLKCLEISFLFLLHLKCLLPKWLHSCISFWIWSTSLCS